MRNPAHFRMNSGGTSARFFSFRARIEHLHWQPEPRPIHPSSIHHLSPICDADMNQGAPLVVLLGHLVGGTKAAAACFHNKSRPHQKETRFERSEQ